MWKCEDVEMTEFEKFIFNPTATNFA